MPSGIQLIFVVKGAGVIVGDDDAAICRVVAAGAAVAEVFDDGGEEDTKPPRIGVKKEVIPPSIPDTRGDTFPAAKRTTPTAVPTAVKISVVENEEAGVDRDVEGLVPVPDPPPPPESAAQLIRVQTKQPIKIFTHFTILSILWPTAEAYHPFPACQ